MHSKGGTGQRSAGLQALALTSVIAHCFAGKQGQADSCLGSICPAGGRGRLWVPLHSWLWKWTPVPQKHSSACSNRREAFQTAQGGKGLDVYTGSGGWGWLPSSWAPRGQKGLTAVELIAVVGAVSPAVTAQLVPDTPARFTHEHPRARCRGEGRPQVHGHQPCLPRQLPSLEASLTATLRTK